MLDRDTGYAPRASDGYTSNYLSSTEELDDDSGYHQCQWGTSTTAQPYLEGNNPCVDQPMGDALQTELFDEGSQQHWGSAGGSAATKYGHPVASMSLPEWQCQTPSVAEHSREGAQADDQRLQWKSPSTHAILGELDIFNNDDGTEYSDEDDEVIGTYASDYPGSAKLIAPQPLFTTGHSLPPEGSGDVFFLGVLSREDDHQQALGTYTNRLLHRIDPLEHGLRSHVGAAMDNPTSSNPDNWSMPNYENTSAAQPWQPIGGQHQIEVPDVGSTDGSQCQAQRNTPVAVHQTGFDPRSR